LREELRRKRARLAPAELVLMEGHGMVGRVQGTGAASPSCVAIFWVVSRATKLSPEKTPELAQAARRTLEMRVMNGVGWSLAYKNCVVGKIAKMASAPARFVRKA